MTDSQSVQLSQAQSDELIANYQQVIQRLQAANQQHAQNAKLLAVSKTKPAEMIRALAAVGQLDFGENYLQEALQKIAQLNDLPLRWHYIGSIQRNKTRDIAKYFDWVHTVARDVIANRLNEQRAGLEALNVLIQVNIDDEDSKSGCQIADVSALVQTVLACENLRLRGLMVIPNKDGSDAFVRTKQLFDEIAQRFSPPHWDSLSMGMSHDMSEAIAQGATMVRVGTAIFGARDYQN